MYNISNILKYTIAVYLLFIFIDKKMMRIRFGFRERDFALRYPKIDSTINMLIGYISIILLFIFTILQEKTQFIRILLYCDPIVLTVAIYTMYGIFVSFIQFLINYSSTNSRDFYWGRSKTKLLLMDSIEYRIFNSTLFRMLLLYLSVYSILNFKKLFLLSKYYGYADSLFYVSIIIIMVEFIVLFIKGIMISNVLFFVQEDGDRISRQIKRNIINEYQLAFDVSINLNRDYSKVIFTDLSNIEKSQREEMVYSVLCHVYSWYEIWDDQDKKFLVTLEKILSRPMRQNSCFKLTNLRSINSDFWNRYQQSELELPFEKLINIYTKQEDLMFYFMQKEFGGDKEKFSSMFEKVYKMDNSLLGDFLCVPSVFWKSLSSQKDIILLCESVRDLKIMKMLYHSIEASDYCCTESLREKIIRLYCNFVIEVLKKEKEIIIKMSDKEIEYTLDFECWKEEKINCDQLQRKDTDRVYINYREDLKKALKGRLLNYFIELENNELNQKFIKNIGSFMEIKYIMVFICYRILYTGEDYYFWKEEILYFKKLISSRYDEDNIFEKQNVDFIAEIINNKIGHKIRSDFIKWIFNNIDSPINESIVKESSEREYLSLAIFISFKYIFIYENIYHSFLEDTNLNDKIRIQFINEISKIRGVMRERDFIEVLYYVFGDQKNYIEIDKLILNGNFESFMIVSNFINMKKMMEYINTHVRIGNDGVLRFLLIKSSEFDYQKILSSLDSEVQEKIARLYEGMLSRSCKTIDEFVDDLCIRAYHLGIEIPQHRKDKAINILRTLIS